MDPNQPTAQIMNIISTDENEFEYSFSYFKAFRDISLRGCRIENCAKAAKNTVYFVVDRNLKL